MVNRFDQVRDLLIARQHGGSGHGLCAPGAFIGLPREADHRAFTILGERPSTEDRDDNCRPVGADVETGLELEYVAAAG